MERGWGRWSVALPSMWDPFTQVFSWLLAWDLIRGMLAFTVAVAIVFGYIRIFAVVLPWLVEGAGVATSALEHFHVGGAYSRVWIPRFYVVGRGRAWWNDYEPGLEDRVYEDDYDGSEVEGDSFEFVPAGTPPAVHRDDLAPQNRWMLD